MKKILYLLVLLLPLSTVKADILDNIFKETEFAYYRNSYTAQYNSAKAEYYDPADATLQDTKYSVCSRYTSNVYKNAFDIKIPGDTNKLMKFADANYQNGEFSKYVRAYHDCYSNEANTGTCIKMTETDYNKLIMDLRPGDVMVYTTGTIEKSSGHALIVYDTFSKNKEGEDVYDAYVLNSTGGATIYSRALGTNRLFYAYRINTDNNIVSSGVNKSVQEGTIKMETFRSDARFNFTSSNLSYGIKGSTKYRVAILRFIVNNQYPTYDSSYKVTKNNDLDIMKSNGYLRTIYKDLTISKTVSASDNDVVSLNEELIYTITIKNNSDTDYGRIYVEEALNNSNYATIIEAPDGVISDNTVNYTISSLGAGKTKILTYKVKVTNDFNYLNNTIISTGKISNTNDFKLSLTTGTVKNKIDNKLTEEKKEAIKNSYYALKETKSGLDLINEVYKDALDIDLNLNNFVISNLIVQDTSVVNACNNKGTSGRSCKDAFKLGDIKIGDTDYYYKDIILNNYWSAVINSDSSLNDDSVDFDSSKPQKQKDLYTWSGSGDSTKRAKTIIGENFENGDILIYYNSNDFISSDSTQNRNSYEDGLYAYIYIDGAFVGINNTGNKNRDAFTPAYYEKYSDLKWYVFQSRSDLPDNALSFINYQTLYNKYYYVILRPALSEGIMAGITAEFTPSPDENGDILENDNEDLIDDSLPTEDPVIEEEYSTDVVNPSTGDYMSKIVLVVLIISFAILYLIVNKKKLIR